MKKFLLLFLFFQTSIAVSPLIAQTDVSDDEFEFVMLGYYQIRLNEGGTLYGYLKEKKDTYVILSTKNNPSLKIDISQIYSARLVNPKDVVNGKLMDEYNFGDRFYFTNSAHGIEEDQLVYRNSYLFLSSLSYGITDHISITAGTELISNTAEFLSGGRRTSFFVNTKIAYPISDKFSAGGGIMVSALGAYSEGERNNVMVLGYGVATLGGPSRNISFGLGYNIERTNNFNGGYAFISGNYRLLNNLSLVTENWIFPNLGIINSGGLRIFGDLRSVDLGVTSLPLWVNSNGRVIPLPYIGYTRRFE